MDMKINNTFVNKEKVKNMYNADIKADINLHWEDMSNNKPYLPGINIKFNDSFMLKNIQKSVPSEVVNTVRVTGLHYSPSRGPEQRYETVRVEMPVIQTCKGKILTCKLENKMDAVIMIDNIKVYDLSDPSGSRKVEVPDLFGAVLKNGSDIVFPIQNNSRTGQPKYAVVITIKVNTMDFDNGIVGNDEPKELTVRIKRD